MKTRIRKPKGFWKNEMLCFAKEKPVKPWSLTTLGEIKNDDKGRGSRHGARNNQLY